MKLESLTQIRERVEKKKKIEHTPSLSSLLMFNYYGELNIVASFIFSSRAGMMGNNKWHCDGNVI
jgi:hypothetical protein